MNTIKEIINTSKDLALNSTAYGISNILRSKKLFNKLFWIFYMLISSAAAAYYIFENISSYLEYEVVTIIKQEYKQPTEFPTVTFCSFEPKYFDGKNITQELDPTYFNYDYSIGKNFKDHFEQFESTYYGRCFRFNSGKKLNGESIPIKNSSIGGFDDSFRIGIKAPYGLVVWIHNQTAPPKIEYFSKYSDIPIFVSSKAKNFLNEQYTQVKCFELCFDLNYIETNPCNCTNATIGQVWNNCWIIGEKKNTTSCTFKDRAKFRSSRLIEECSKYCPLECDSISYEVTPNTFTTKEVSNETVEMFAFYRSLRFLTITEKPKISWTDLIANVGGYFGLFVGISFVTLFEIAEIIIESVIILYKSKKRVSLARFVLNKNINEMQQKRSSFSNQIQHSHHKPEAPDLSKNSLSQQNMSMQSHPNMISILSADSAFAASLLSSLKNSNIKNKLNITIKFENPSEDDDEKTNSNIKNK